MKAQRINKISNKFYRPLFWGFEIFTSIFIFCAFITSNAQPAYNYFNGASFYEKQWNGNMNPPQWVLNSTYPYSIVKTLDSNLFIAGWGPWRSSFNPIPDAPLAFIKSGPLGTLKWSTHLRDSLAVYPNPTHTYELDLEQSVQTQADSGYISVVDIYYAEYNVWNYAPWLFKFDKNGNYQWAKYYSNDTSFITNQTSVKVITSNYSGGFLLICNIPGKPNLLINCDKDGNIIWKKFLGLNVIFFMPVKIVKTPDYGYLIHGLYGNSSFVSAALKIDSLGNAQFFKQYNISTYFSYGEYSMSEWNNGQYFICGNTQTYNTVGGYSPFIISIDVLGNVNWCKVYNGSGTDDSTVFAHDITVLRNGDLLVCGARTKNKLRELSYFKTDNSGNLLWTRSRNNSSNVMYEGQQLLKFDNDVLMTWGGNFTNWTFARLSPAGEGICNYESRSWYEVPVNLTVFTSSVVPDTSSSTINIIPPPLPPQFVHGVPDSVVCLTYIAGISDANTAQNDILIYPNPTSGEFQIQVNNKQFATDKEYKIEIYNVLGETVYSSQILNPESLILNPALPSGVYFISIKTQQGTVNKKLIVNK